MASVHEDPTEVVVIGYTWTNGNASGGKREVFLSLAEAERRLAALIDGGEVKHPEKVTARRLTEGQWAPMGVQLPTTLRIVGGGS